MPSPELPPPAQVVIALARPAPDPRALAATVGLDASALAAPAPDPVPVAIALQDLRALPALQRQARRFAVSLARDCCPLDEIVAEVARDPVLTVNVLRLANTVEVSSRERIGDLPTALQMLGVVRVRVLAQLLAALHDARGVAPGFDWSHLWLHSAATASLASRLDAWAGEQSGPELHLAALLHDIGKIALSAVAPDAYRAVLLRAWSRWQALPPLEHAALGLDHRDAGRLFGESAQLPPIILSAITHHDAPELAPTEHRTIVAVVAVANRIAKSNGLGFSGDGDLAFNALGDDPAWKTWENAVGRPLDAATLSALLEEKWLEEVRGELRSLQRALG